MSRQAATKAENESKTVSNDFATPGPGTVGGVSSVAHEIPKQVRRQLFRKMLATIVRDLRLQKSADELGFAYAGRLYVRLAAMLGREPEHELADLVNVVCGAKLRARIPRDWDPRDALNGVSGALADEGAYQRRLAQLLEATADAGEVARSAGAAAVRAGVPGFLVWGFTQALAADGDKLTGEALDLAYNICRGSGAQRDELLAAVRKLAKKNGVTTIDRFGPLPPGWRGKPTWIEFSHHLKGILSNHYNDQQHFHPEEVHWFSLYWGKSLGLTDAPGAAERIAQAFEKHERKIYSDARTEAAATQELLKDKRIEELAVAILQAFGLDNTTAGNRIRAGLDMRTMRGTHSP